jgi:hypothetical protein
MDVDLKQAVITDVEYHCEGTGELLTIWVRAKDGNLYSLIPVEYKFGILACPYAEKYHGGK